MDLFGMHQGYYDQIYMQPYEYGRHASFGHEVLGGAAAFAAFKAYEHRQRQNGHPISHPGAKAALAAIAGFEIEKLLENHHYRHIDREMARRHAEEQSMLMYDQRYGGMDPYGPPMGYGPPMVYEPPPMAYGGYGGGLVGVGGYGPPMGYGYQGGYGYY